ncbi:chorismate-binding protein [Virgibacillus sp. W0430]|uniref:chorismate-binding protein n=1 Tax=Virgibacillus sp. W0430 TaxID=3391580 RepID=UPI003F464BEC
MRPTNSPLLYFNFKNSEQKTTTPLLFKNPIKIVTAVNVEEVLASLSQIQEAVNKGYYAAGYIAYEAAPAFDPSLKVNQNSNMPLLWFGIFTNPSTETITTREHTLHAWKPSITVAEYHDRIGMIHNYIREGITSQINYTFPFHAEFSGDPFSYYQQLKNAQQADYTAYLNTGKHAILSASPELFFHFHNGKVVTKPMKGTIERGKTYEQDEQNKQWLKNSEKNRLENKLIVDLMCEDLKKVSVDSSIQITNEFEVEKYPTVFQMTSTIKADVLPNKGFIDLLKVLFPSGSITGMPKRKSMDIISLLEKEPREVYCGAIGYITPANEAIFNVPIRTVFIDSDQHKATYHAGGGITAHSRGEEEYNEVLAKAKILTEIRDDFQLLETLCLDHGTYLLLNNHLERLKKSAAYFNYQLNISKIKNQLEGLAIKKHTKKWKVRLLVHRNGATSLEATELPPLETEINVALSNNPINKDNIFLYHKTTNRKVYHTHRKKNVFDTLLWNENKEITEFTIGNIVVELNNTLYTPPIESGLLHGTLRQQLLADNIIEEKKIFVKDLHKCTKIWLINSVRGWVSVRLI